jgi:hypothetical protein
MIDEIVKQKLKAKKWKFADISNIDDTVKELSEYVYDTLTAKEKLDLIWNENIGEQMTFGGLFQEIAQDAIGLVVAKAIKNELDNATISFKNEDDNNEVSKRSVGWKSHKERTTDEKGHSEE